MRTQDDARIVPQEQVSVDLFHLRQTEWHGDRTGTAKYERFPLVVARPAGGRGEDQSHNCPACGRALPIVVWSKAALSKITRIAGIAFLVGAPLFALLLITRGAWQKGSIDTALEWLVFVPTILGLAAGVAGGMFGYWARSLERKSHGVVLGRVGTQERGGRFSDHYIDIDAAVKKP